MSSTNSILISSHNRLGLFRRTLWSIAEYRPEGDLEVVVVDDGSTELVLEELKTFSSQFKWTFIRFNAKEFEECTGLTKWLNNPAVTNNIAFRASRGDLIFQQGNEVMASPGCYDKLIADAPGVEHFMVMSTTYDVPERILRLLDNYGSNFHPDLRAQCKEWPLQSWSYRSDVTNYISLAPRRVWNALKGYDERYYAGIAAEDSDFVRRARTLPGFTQVISEAVSYHQSHGGRTKYQLQSQKTCSNERWDEGVAINRAIYDSWTGETQNPQPWAWGTFGVGEILSNWQTEQEVTSNLLWGTK